MTNSIPTISEKCQGAMLATAIGDALGWPNENKSKNISKPQCTSDYFIEWTRRCGRPYWHTEKILAGEYSDDTQMTLAVARSIIAGNWEEIFTQKELTFWLRYERGGGKALIRAAKSYKNGATIWKSTHNQDYFNAGGNGTVMRILPHVISHAFIKDEKTLIIEVIKDCILTHGHPRAILGATCYAFALNFLLCKENTLEYGELVSAIINSQNVWSKFPTCDELSEWCQIVNQEAHYNYEQEWNSVRSKMLTQLEFIQESLKKGLMIDDIEVLTQLECFGKSGGAGDVAILAAVYLTSRYANNPMLGIKVPAFSIGIDSDTIASITGGLLGMLCGNTWIPLEWRIVQDYDCLIKITELLLAENKKEAAKSFVACVKEKEDAWKQTPIGLMRPINSFILSCGKNTNVTVTKWQSILGQTIYIKDYKTINNNLCSSNSLQLSFQNSTENDTFQNETMLNNKRFQLTLTNSDIIFLLNESSLKNKTFGKVLQIINMLFNDTSDSRIIANRLNVDKEIVDIIKKYIK